jgi:hypothetical protein
MNFVYLIHNYCFSFHIFWSPYLGSENSETRSEKNYDNEILVKRGLACVGKLQLCLWETVRKDTRNIANDLQVETK